MIPKYLPTTVDGKLGRLVEECGETLAAVGKSLRWGLDSYNPEIPEDQRELNGAWIQRELADLEHAVRVARSALEKLGYRRASTVRGGE